MALWYDYNLKSTDKLIIKSHRFESCSFIVWRPTKFGNDPIYFSDRSKAKFTR